MKTYSIIFIGWMVFFLVVFAGKSSTAIVLYPKVNKTKTGKNIHLTKLPDLVVFEKEGRTEGVSAAYGGALGDAIVIAGGCNFPQLAAAEGGPKVYYDQIYVLSHPETQFARWEKAGRLPVEAANGVSVTLPEGVVCIGGRNAKNTLNGVWLLKWNADQSVVITEQLAALPVAMDNMSGSTDGKNIYVSGGNIDGKPGNRCFVLKGISASEWIEIPPFPGPARLQPVGVVCHGKYYLMGGFQPVQGDQECIVLTNGVCYNPDTQQWSFTSEIKPEGESHLRALVGAAGLALDDQSIVFQGGVNLTVFKAAVDNPLLQSQALERKQDSLWARLKQEQAVYMRHAPEWYQFNRQLLIYHVKTDSWKCIGDFRELAKAGAVMIAYKNKWIIVNGESKPGIRSAGVYMIDL